MGGTLHGGRLTGHGKSSTLRPISSYLLVEFQPISKEYARQIGSLPQISDENKKYVKTTNQLFSRSWNFG